MIYDVYQKIALNLKKIRKIDVFIEDIPQNINTPLFLIHFYEQMYIKEINDRRKKEINVDVLYFPKSKDELKKECLILGDELFRDFNLDNFKIYERSINIVDDVLHFMFKINYKEYKNDCIAKINELEGVNNGRYLE